MEGRDDGVFLVFGVGEGERVMVIGYQNREVRRHPQTEHGSVDDVGEGGLGIKGNSFANSRWIVTSSMEPPLSAHKADQIASLVEFIGDVALPSLVGWEGGEVFGLEFFNDGDG